MTLPLDIIHAARHLLELGQAELASNHPRLSQSDLSVLLSVFDEPGLTANQLASRLGRDKTTVSRSVSGLINERLIRSEIDSVDGRRRNLFLTDAGLIATDPAIKRIQEETEKLTSRMTDEHVDMFTEFLQRIRKKE